MRTIKNKAEAAMAIAITQGVTFSEALKVADGLLKAQDEYIMAHMPEKGKVVVCEDNVPTDQNFTACTKLKVNGKYMVTGEDENGRIFVEDMETGQKIGEPFYKIRFYAVQE